MRLFLIVALAGCISEDRAQERWDEFLLDHSSCETVDDCAVVYPGCPLGCASTVSEEHVEEAMELADDLIGRYERAGRSCMYDCIEASDPECNDGKCELSF